MMRPPRLQLLGGFEIEMPDGISVSINSRKAVAVLSFIAMHPGRKHSREQLAMMLWEDTPPEQARTNLRQVLSKMRRSVPKISDALDIGVEHILIHPEALSTDVAEFECAADARTAGSLVRAATLYRGDLLAHLRPCSDAFEAWLIPERERLRFRVTTVLRTLLETMDEHEESASFIALALRLLGLDPAQEAIHRALMRFYARQGRYHDAIRQYEACRKALRREIEVVPDDETEGLLRHIMACRRKPPVQTCMFVSVSDWSDFSVQRGAEAGPVRRTD